MLWQDLWMLEPFQADEEDVANPGKVFEPMDEELVSKK
jgi:hypothetical protein